MKRLLLSILAPVALLAQLGGSLSAGGSSVATQLPLSGRTGQSGGAIAAQTPIPGTTTSVNTLNTTVQVTGPYAGSASSIAKMPFSGKLTLSEAVQRALAYNLGSISVTTAIRQAQGQSRVARSVLLPNLSGAFRENYLTQDLQALGIRVPFLPAVVGPINYFDLRATLTQNFFDLTSLNNYKATKEVVQANQQALQDARDTVVLAVGASYLQVIAAKARVDSAKTQLDTAEAVFKQTTQRRQAGLAAQLEVNQDSVREKTQRQRIATLENDLARQKINLARLTGLPPNDKYDLAENVAFSSAPNLSVDEAVKQALDSRADLKAADAQVRAAERSKAAAKAERLPTLAVSADLGEIGPRFNEGASTYTVAGSIKIPIWQGGRVEGDIAQSEAALDQRRAERDDTRGRIESDVRNAYLDLEAAGNQLDLAKSNQAVARESLRLTREKFDAGVSDSVEVTQAVEAVSSADLDYITALFAHNLAKLSLARALGQTETHIAQFLSTEPARR